MADYARVDDWQLGRRRHQIIQEMGEVEEELSKRRAQDRHVVKKGEQVWTERSGQGMRWKEGFQRTTLVSPALGFNVYNLHAFMVKVPSGSTEGAYHMHGEAIKYYIAGRGVEMIGGKRYDVEAGDVCFIPHHTWHGTQNPYDEPLHVLAVTDHTTPLQVPIIFRIREDLREGS